MARRLRHLHPDLRLVHVTFKCVDDAFLLFPDPRTVALLAVILSEALERYGVNLHAICVVSNHAHLVLGIEGARLDLFMQFLLSQVARQMNERLGRSGAFFKGRYRHEPILSDGAFFAKLQYVHAQPVRHDLTARADQWPGLSSYTAMVSGAAAIEVRHFDDNAWRAAGAKPAERGAFTTEVSVPTTKPPQWTGLSAREEEAARRALRANMSDYEAEMAADRRARGHHLPAPSSYTKQDPRKRPKGRAPFKPQPWAHGTAEQVDAYRAAYSETLAAYKVASAQYRSTGHMCPFPRGTYPPRIPVPFEVT